MNKKSKGFTLIEVLGTIVIITIVFGIVGSVVFSIINNSKSKSKEVAISNIERIGKVYVNEYPEEVGWVKVGDSDNKFTCVSVKNLVFKGYLKEEQAIGSYIKIVKDNIGNVISNEMVDSPEVCGFKVVDVPISKDLCNNFTYGEGTSKDLINKVNSINIEYDNFNGNERTAGDYKFKLSLNDGYVWNDDSLDEKSVICTIKKKYPTIKLEQDENDSIGEKIITLTSFDVFGDVYVKSSNLKYVTVVGTEDGKIEAGGEEKLKLNIIANRENTATYITVTVVPTGEYAKNYYTKSMILPITNVRKFVNVTYKEKDGKTIGACATKTIVYGGLYGDLCNPTEVSYGKKGYIFGGWYYNSDLTGEPVSLAHIVKNDNDHSVYAKWIPNKILVRYNVNGGQMAAVHGDGYDVDSNGFVTKDGKIYEQKFYYGEENINLSDWNYVSKINVKRVGHKAVEDNEWYSKNAEGVIAKKFNQNVNEVNLQSDDLCDATNGDCTVTLYVNWKPNKIYVKYNTQYGTLQENGVYKLNNSNKNVLKNGSENVDIFDYDETNINLHNYNNNNNLNIVNSSLFVPSGIEWRTSDGTKFFNQAEGAENANSLCDAKNTDCTITLYVNWHVKLILKQYNNNANLASDVVKTLMYKGSQVSFDLGTPKSYINSSECGTWTTLGWANSAGATANVAYNNGAKASLNKNTTLYARYQRKTSFILDYNGANNPISSYHQTMDRSASGQSNNIGNFTITLNPSDLLVSRSGYKLYSWCEDKDGKKNADGSLSCDDIHFKMFSDGKLYNKNAENKSITLDYTCEGRYIFANWQKN